MSTDVVDVAPEAEGEAHQTKGMKKKQVGNAKCRDNEKKQSQCTDEKGKKTKLRRKRMKKRKKRANSKQEHEERHQEKIGGGGTQHAGNEGGSDEGGGGKQGNVEDELTTEKTFEKTVPCTQSAQAPELAEAIAGEPEASQRAMEPHEAEVVG